MYSCDTAIIMQHELKHILGRTLETTVLTDSASLFNVMIRNEPITEKRLMIYSKEEREAYDEEIIDDIISITRTYNLAHAMTKTQINNDLLMHLITTNYTTR